MYKITKKRENELQELLKVFEKASARIGLKYSAQREWIIKAIFLSEKHLSTEEVVEFLKTNFQIKVSITTVYRNIKSLVELGVIDVLDIDGVKKFEIKPNMHHDHLVCRDCGKILEFHSKEIEEFQKKIADELEFTLTSHVLTLYGICKQCKEKA